MGYANLSIYVGKTSKKVSGQQNFYGPVKVPSKLKKQKILGPQNLEFLLRASKDLYCLRLQYKVHSKMGVLALYMECYSSLER